VVVLGHHHQQPLLLLRQQLSQRRQSRQRPSISLTTCFDELVLMLPPKTRPALCQYAICLRKAQRIKYVNNKKRDKRGKAC